MEVGVCLAGGGALLSGLDERISDELNMRVWVADDPMTCVARGAGIMLDNLDINRQFLVSTERTPA
jgi:rod shape-determining protein MreB